MKKREIATGNHFSNFYFNKTDICFRAFFVILQILITFNFNYKAP